MKALVYEKAHSLENFAMKSADVAEPTVRDRDVLVEVHAVGINPGEAFFRSTQSAQPGGRILLGFEFAGIVIGVGSSAAGFKKGDRVFGTGDVTRDGAWAEKVAVDHRIVAKTPDQLAFADAASLPIGAATAWEAMFRDDDALPYGVERVLIIGGAGGVGSVATQLLKAKTKALVISTASRPKSKDWCAKMGADLVLDHRRDIPEQLAAANIPHVDMVLSLSHSGDNIEWIAKVLRPFGHLSVVDMSPGLNPSLLMMKALSLHTEMVFTRIMHDSAPELHGAILKAVADYTATGKVQPIATTHLKGLTPETMRAAQTQVEEGHSIGKVVITTRNP
jgi:zinc-binding alcohol dehydrogenase family protein